MKKNKKDLLDIVINYWSYFPELEMNKDICKGIIHYYIKTLGYKKLKEIYIRKIEDAKRTRTKYKKFLTIYYKDGSYYIYDYSKGLTNESLQQIRNTNYLRKPLPVQRTFPG